MVGPALLANATSSLRSIGWARTYEALGVELGESNASREEKRAAAVLALMADFKDDLARAAMAAELDRRELDAWMEDAENAFATMPMIGRIMEVTHRRLCNPQHPWRVNDLNDMHFLACAAGYADFLLAEKATSNDLRCIEGRVPVGACICRSPGELADLIEAGDAGATCRSLARPVSQRS